MSDLIFHDEIFVEYLNHMGNDREITDAARVSTLGVVQKGPYYEAVSDLGFNPSVADVTAAIEKVDAADRGLINMLMRDRHGSPFEHCVIKVYVKAPIFVFREWHRHRIASYNEMSGRYTKLFPEFYVPAADRPLIQVGKPGAYTFEPGTEEMLALTRGEIKKVAEVAWESYERMLEANVAKEVARAVLPVTTYSQMVCTMNLRALMNFLSLRTKQKENSAVPSFPQHEISLGADILEDIFAARFPWTHAAFEANGRVAP